MNLISFLIVSMTVFAGETKPFCPEAWEKRQKEVAATQEIRQYLGREGTSPFSAACHGKRDMNNPLPTGIGRLGTVGQDSSGTQASDFFFDLLTKIEEYALSNIQLSQNIELCLTGKVKHPDCDGVKKWADVDVPERVKEARFELSVAADVDAWSGKLGIPNGKLQSLHTFKAEPWQKTTPEELKTATRVLQDYTRDARKIKDATAAGKSLLGRVEVMDEEMNKKRVIHLVKYRRIISELPMMNYLTSPNPTRGQITRAAVLTRIHAEKELQKIREMKVRLAQNPRFLNAELYHAISYTTQLEGLLLENPNYCRLGAYYFQTKGNREIAAGIATLPLLAASFFVAPPVAVALGAGVGGLWFGVAQSEYSATKQKNLAQVIGEEENNEQLRSTKFERDLNLAMWPAAATGAGLASKFASRLQKVKALKIGN